jgi:hypothetical protein
LSKVIALIDLDTPVYKAAAAVEERGIIVTHSPTGVQKSFGTRTEFKDLLKSKDKIDKLSEYEIQDTQEAEPVENACFILNNHIKFILDSFWCDEVVYMMSGKTNFRNDLPLPTKYKSNRVALKPLLLKQVQTFAWKKYKAIVTQNEEPDDMQVWMGYEILKRGDIPILVTGDKDSKAYSGLSLFNPDKPEDGVQVIPDLGSIWEDEKGKVRALGMKQYGLQQLIGDTIDGFKPTELCGVKFGEKSALKLLEPCKTEKEVLEVVVQQYQKWYPKPFEYTAWDGKEIESDWKHMLGLFHKCCRMKETKDDPLIAYDFYKRYGVILE